MNPDEPQPHPPVSARADRIGCWLITVICSLILIVLLFLIIRAFHQAQRPGEYKGSPLGELHESSRDSTESDQSPNSP